MIKKANITVYNQFYDDYFTVHNAGNTDKEIKDQLLDDIKNILSNSKTIQEKNEIGVSIIINIYDSKKREEEIIRAEQGIY